jgi:GT2 family glycosyltransferase
MQVDTRVVGGAFSRRYDPPSLVLSLTCRVADWRGSLGGLFLGDQGIFVRRSVFERLEGFRDLLVFEDLDFSIRMKQQGRVIRLRSRVTSSARRFQRRGPLTTSWRDLRATWQFLRGRNEKDILQWLNS